MTNEEIYHKVRSHLLEQGERAGYEGAGGRSFVCQYKDSKGRMCAVGCLIDPEHENAEQAYGSDGGCSLLVDSWGWGVLGLEKEVAGIDGSLQLLLGTLQEIHDSLGYGAKSWDTELPESYKAFCDEQELTP